MTTSNRGLSLEEVLDTYFLDNESPSSETVLRACKAYPEFREDILEFAALWTAYDAAPVVPMEDVAHVSEDSVSRVQSHVLNSLYVLDRKSASRVDTEGARTAVKALAGANLKRAAAAAGLGASTVLLSKVLTKSIVNIPIRVLRALAQHLKVEIGALQEVLGADLAGAKSYRATDSPNLPRQETWDSAVDALLVDDDERARLHALLTVEDTA